MVINFYDDYIIKSNPTGSNYICNPPVTNTDIDTVVLAKPGYESHLAALGWEPHSGEGYEVMGGDFVSWRKGNKNYIVTVDPEFYKKFVLATRISKMLNLLNKEDRIFMFKLVLHGDGLPSVNTAIPSAPGNFHQWETWGDLQWEAAVVPPPSGQG